MEKRFLYGAAVQGIQSFIYQTNDLREIIGASEMVDFICNGMFQDEIKDCKAELVLHAAGNIKCIFSSREECEHVVRIFPKKVVTYAPGITISQAVVPFDGNENFADVVNELERKLRIQRNRPMRSQTLGYLGLKRDESVAHEKRDNCKLTNLSEKCFGDKFSGKLAQNNDDLGDSNSWVAVIHIDGNGLGQVVQKIGGDREKFSKFSEELNSTTIKSAQQAFRECCPNLKDDDVIPIYPVILGGDDLTVICRGSIAVKYAECFMKNFEKETKEIEVLKGNGLDGLTACAGIAFIKASFPFASGYELAESLCSDHAKKTTRTASCMMFHKMQDSFNQDYRDIISRELTPRKGVSFSFGPYFLNEDDAKEYGKWSIQHLIYDSECLNKDEENSKNSTKSALRHWLSEMHNDEESAKQLIERAKEIIQGEDLKKLLNEATTPVECVEMEDGSEQKVRKFPAYDILAYHTIMTQVVNKGETK